MNRLILEWEAALEGGQRQSGGKGWRIALMRRLGINVPDGFIISAECFRGRALEEPVRQSILDATCGELERRGWAEAPVAVRSSAAHEDGSGASFAGIYRSVLNVQGRERIGAAVQDVLDSYWSPQALAYRRRARIAEDDGSMAVMLMPMLQAVAAGVAFTCDPVSGREDRVVINATSGLADALVNAQIDGEEYVLSREGTHLDLTRQSKKASHPALNQEQALQLGQLVTDVANALDYTDPCYDIEWVWDGKAFWIVQARPITTRAHATYRQLADQPILWSRANSKEVVPHPFAALDWSFARQLLPRMLTCASRLARYKPLEGARRMMLRRGRLYYETSIMQWESFDAFDVRPEAYNRLLGGNQPAISVPQSTIPQRLNRALHSIRFLLRSIGPRMRAAETIRRVHKYAAIRTCEEPPTSRSELARCIRENVELLLNNRDLPLLQAAGSALFMLTDFLGKRCGDEGYSLAAALMAGGSPSVTAIQNLRLLRLARLAGDEPRVLSWLRDLNRTSGAWFDELPDSEFRTAFLEFLREFGHRGVYESYLSSPRWRESPGYVFDVISGLVGVSVHEVEQRQTAVLLEANKRLREIVPPWMRPVVFILAKLAQSERRMREGARSALIAQLGVIRTLVLELYRRLQETSASLECGDLFHLTFDELYSVARGEMPIAAAQCRAAWRRKQFTDYERESEPDVIVESTRTSKFVHEEDRSRAASESRNSEEWSGTVIAAGSARGVAHVARHPSEAINLESGAILVAPATDPAWTPVFLKAAAVVVEVGGYISHSAIVAREFGIPALSNVRGIVAHISTGDVLEIDGERSCVRRIRTRTEI